MSLSAKRSLRLIFSPILVWKQCEAGEAAEDGGIKFELAVGTEKFAIMDELLAGNGQAVTVSAKETKRAVETVRTEGSGGLAEIVGATDADESLKLKWFVVAGEIKSRALPAEL